MKINYKRYYFECMRLFKMLLDIYNIVLIYNGKYFKLILLNS